MYMYGKNHRRRHLRVMRLRAKKKNQRVCICIPQLREINTLTVFVEMFIALQCCNCVAMPQKVIICFVWLLVRICRQKAGMRYSHAQCRN
mmetsp:Transcript_7925/g.11735  ORF Transcript_7925/g.11735 Transcript_7925/m.11735 type:complete len:90 (+) Transcript_7925:148-417(+)